MASGIHLVFLEPPQDSGPGLEVGAVSNKWNNQKQLLCGAQTSCQICLLLTTQIHQQLHTKILKNLSPNNDENRLFALTNSPRVAPQSERVWMNW